MHRTIGWSTWCAPEVSRERSVMRPGCTAQSRAAYLKLAESLPKHLNRGADLTRAFARRSRLHAKPRPSSPSGVQAVAGCIASHRVRRRSEIELSHRERRHDERPATLRAGDADRGTDRLDVVEHEQRGFVEAEVLDRLRDLAVLVVEDAVAREPCVENGARIDRPQIPEPRHENAARRGPDHLRGRRGPAEHLERARAGSRFLPLLLRPESGV